MIDLAKLNTEQKQAVTTSLQPTLIVAGAGTGKTRVLTTRIAYLINEVGLSPHRICAITFTNKAAMEMKTRVSNLIKDGAKPSWITTYHSLCLRILREDMIHQKRTTNFNIIDEEDQSILVRDIYKKHQLNSTLIKPNKMIKLISFFKSNNLDINDNYSIDNLKLLGLRSYDELKILKISYRAYEKYLDTNNLLDFDDLINFTHDLLSLNLSVRNKWQNHFDAVLVDEFQDTNKKQFEILKYLVNPQHNNVFVVGDPDQTIYTWRGAYANIFDEFYSTYNNVCTIVLHLNYRSSQNIINCSNRLITNNINRIEKKLKSNNDLGEEVSLFTADNPSEEAHFISKQIKKLVLNKKYKYSQIAILYRSNFLSRYIEQELISNQIPYVIFGGLKFYQRKEIKDIIAYLKLIKNDDELSFKRVVNTPSRKIGETTIDKIQRYADNKKMTLIDASKIKLTDDPEITWNPTNIHNFWNLIDVLKQKLKDQPLSELVEFLLDKIDYYSYLKSLDFDSRIDNIHELIKAIKLFEAEHNNLHGMSLLNEYLSEIQLYTDADTRFYDNESKKDFVSLMTVHFAKGTEFDVVFLISLVDGIMPIIKIQSPNDIEEERRIAYVAITRAKHKLYLTTALNNWSYENGLMLPSRFIREIGEKNLKIEHEEFKSISSKDLNWFDSKTPQDYATNNYENKNIDFSIGDVVVHTIFQSGYVIGVGKDTIDVLFKSPHGKKTIMKNHKSIKRIKN